MDSSVDSLPAPAPFNLADYVLTAGRATPDKLALSILGADGSEDWNYRRLEQAVRAVASGFQARGLGPGDVILLRLGNQVDFPLAFLGAIWAGCLPFPTSAQLTAPEITKLALIARPAATVAGPGIALPDAPGEVIEGDAVLDTGSAANISPEMGDPNRAGYYVATSGTGGSPRIVIHAHRAVWARQSMYQGWYGMTAEDVMLHAGAFNWTFTLGTGLLDPWTMGATALVPADGTKGADLPALAALHKATILAGAPGLYRQALRADPFPVIPSLRHALSAGEALPDPIRAAWLKATGTEIHEAYGMSECSTFVSGSPNRPSPKGTTGFVQPGRRIAVLNEDGTPLPASEPGTLAIHADDPGLMLGYLGEARGAHLTNGWFVTADVMSQGPDGALSYHGRTDDILTAGGFRIAPTEIETALLDHPDITEAGAVDHTLNDTTTVIAAHYAAPAPLDSEALSAHMSERLARFKCPRVFIHHDTLPRGANGKLLRRVLRERIWT